MKIARPDNAARNQMRATHGMSLTPIYSCWRGMLQRCENSKSKDFKRYGARGITVCQRWKSFEAFLEDMGEKPDGLTIERIDTNGNYEPSNCKWATPKQQARNRRDNVILQFNGQSKTVAEWADETGLERKTLEYRIRVGWDVAKALTTPSLINRKAA